MINSGTTGWYLRRGNDDLELQYLIGDGRVNWRQKAWKSNLERRFGRAPCNDDYARGSTWAWSWDPWEDEDEWHYACLHELEDRSLVGFVYIDKKRGDWVQYKLED